MKKAILSALILIAFTFAGCDPGSYFFKKIDYIDNIERIELVEYKNENYKMIDASREALIFDPEKVKKIETLGYDEIEQFLYDFEKIAFFVGNDSVNEPTGYCLLWYLENGNFIVFSCTLIENDRAYSMIAEFDSSCNFVKHHASFDSGPHYDNVLNKYFLNYKKIYN